MSAHKRGVGDAGARGRGSWAVVLLVLAGAAGLILLLVSPWADGTGRARGTAAAATLDGVPLDVPSSAAGEEAGDEEKAASAAVVAEPEEVVPYGDKSLPQEKAIRGRVIDEEGNPVPDAIVVAIYRNWRSYPRKLVQASRVRSEADGSFVLGPLERKDHVVLAVKQGVGVGRSDSKMPGAYVEIPLGAGAKLEGRVTARDGGTPVEGARIIVKDRSYFQETTTDADGKYALWPLSASTDTWQGNEVVVVADGFARAERTNLLLKHGGTYEVDFALDPGQTLRGTVTDATTGQPVAEAVVAEGWESWHKSVEAAEDGTFELPNVDTAPNRVFTVRAPGYLPQQRQSDGSGEIRFELSASLVLKGVVEDPQGQEPLAGARVYLHRLEYAPGYKRASNDRQKNYATTDEEGVFTFESVLPGKIAVIAFHTEHAPGEKGVIEIPVGGPAPDDVRVEMKQGVTVEGVVRDRQDRPLPSIRVSLQKGWGQIKGYKWAKNYIWWENPTWYTDQEGKFVLKGAVPGKLYLNAWHTTYGWSGTTIEGIDGQRLTGIVISFAGQTIEGVFKSKTGEPVPGATVYATGPKNTPHKTWRYTRTDSLGRFKLGGLKDGSYDIRARSTFGNPEPKQDVPAGTTNVELSLKPTQVLEARVTSVLSGRALEQFEVRLQPQKKPGQRRASGTRWSGDVRSPDGVFERPVNAGTYAVTFKAPGHAPQTIGDVIVEEHVAPRELYVVLETGGGIRGTVRGTDGKPLPNVRVRANVHRAPGEKKASNESLLGGSDHADSRGRYFIRGLAPGTYDLQLNLGSRGSARAQVTVSSRELVVQDLQLVPTGKVAFRVTDDEGQPLKGVMFYLRDPGTNRWIGWVRQSNAQGLAVSGALRSGPAKVQVYHRKREWIADNFEIEIRPSRTVTFEVEMRPNPEKKKKQG